MIRFFAERSVPANLLFIILLVAGIFFSLTLPVESIPNISLGVVAVYTPWPGASPEDVEKLLTTKIEEQLENLDHVVWIKSFSVQGLSRIHIKFSEDLPESIYDELYLKTQSEVEKIAEELPEDAETSLVELVDFSMIRPTIVIALGGEMPEKSRNEIAKELKENLMQIPGMDKVRIRGEREQRIVVEVDREHAEKYQLSILDIMDIVRKESSTFPGGTMRLQNSEITIRTRSDRRTIQELREIVLRSYPDGSILRLEDIANISWTYEKWKTIYRVQGAPATFLYCVKEDTQNALTIIPIIKQQVAKFRDQLPVEIYCEFFKDNVLYVNRVLSVLKSNLSLGLVLVFLLLWICIGTSNAILAVIGIPFAFLCAMIFLSWTGNTLNEMVLVSLVLVSGMVVDDAIIILENMYRHYQETGELLSSAICGASEVFWPVISATATTIAAFLPMLLMTGILGKIMSIVPKTVSITLAASLIEAFLILPNHFTDLGKLFSLDSKKQTTYKVGFFARLYLASLQKFLHYRYLATFGFLILFLSGFIILLWTFPISIVLFPSDHHDFWITLKVHENAHIEYTESKVREIEKILETIPKNEIMNYVVQVGRSMDENYQLILDKNVAQFTVTLNPNRTTQRTTDDIIRSVRNKIATAQLQGFKSIDVIHTPNGPQQGKPVAVIIRGDSLQKIGEIRDIIKNKLANIPGVTDIKDDMQTSKYQLSIHFRDEELQRYQINRSLIAQTITSAVEGSEVSEMNYLGKQYKIYVQYAENNVAEINDIAKIRLRIPSGNLIRLDDVAYLTYRKSVAQIPHHNNKRAITVTANIEKNRNTSLNVNSELKDYLTAQLKKYPGYICEYGGEYEETNRSFHALKIAFFIAMLLVYMILGTQFNSFVQPLIIMSIIPFTIVGVGYGLAIFHLPFTMLTFMSTIGMIGIVVNDSLVLIDFINRESRLQQDSIEAIMVACRKRLRPIILTTLTTVLGLLPLALGIGGSSVTWSPMATAFSWGLSIATILTLYVIPALYLITVDAKCVFAKKNKKQIVYFVCKLKMYKGVIMLMQQGVSKHTLDIYFLMVEIIMVNEEFDKSQEHKENKNAPAEKEKDIFGTLRGVPAPSDNKTQDNFLQENPLKELPKKNAVPKEDDDHLQDTVAIISEDRRREKIGSHDIDRQLELNTDRYLILSEIGSGGFGTVYKAFDNLLRREVAIKTIHFDQEYSQTIEYFEKEAHMLAQCNHPNIVQIYDVGKDGDNPCIVMEFVNGLNICDYVKLQRQMKNAKQIQNTICSYMIDFIDALNYMHKRDIYHQDIKPENMLVSLSNNCAKLVDFGLADRPRREETDSFYGTYGFTPPEKFEGRGIPRSHDIYAIGAVFFEILTGRPLHIGRKAEEIIFSVFHGTVQFFPEDMVDKRLEEICRKCLKKDPQQRYRNLNDLYNDLMDYSGNTANVNDYPYLSLVMGDKKLVFPLTHDKNFIGRTFSNHIVIPDPSISRSQAIIQTGKEISIKNLSEVNKIRVGSKELKYEEGMKLTGYEKIAICDYVFHYVPPSETSSLQSGIANIVAQASRASTVDSFKAPISKTRLEAERLGITQDQIKNSMWESTIQNNLNSEKKATANSLQQKALDQDEIEEIKSSIKEMKKMLSKFEEKFSDQGVILIKENYNCDRDTVTLTVIRVKLRRKVL